MRKAEGLEGSGSDLHGECGLRVPRVQAAALLARGKPARSLLLKPEWLIPAAQVTLPRFATAARRSNVDRVHAVYNLRVNRTSPFTLESAIAAFPAKPLSWISPFQIVDWVKRVSGLFDTLSSDVFPRPDMRFPIPLGPSARED